MDSVGDYIIIGSWEELWFGFNFYSELVQGLNKYMV